MERGRFSVIIMGAGGTAGTKRLPADKDFLERSSTLISTYAFLSMALEAIYRGGWVGQRLEDAWSNIDSQYNLPVSMPPDLAERCLKTFAMKAANEASLPANAPKYYSSYWTDRTDNPRKRTAAQYLFLFAGWELRQLISQVYGQELAGGEEKYRDVLAENARQGRVTVIDFNYDVFFEQALGSERYYYYPESSIPQADATEFLKPHGSLNWIHRRIGRFDEAIAAIAGVYPIRSWGYGPDGLSQASIIPMTRAKREFTPEEESQPIRDRFGRIMRRCAEVLRQAQHVCVIGYSFPPGDAYFQDVLRETRTNRDAPLVNLKYIGKEGTIPQWSAILREYFLVENDPEITLDGF